MSVAEVDQTIDALLPTVRRIAVVGLSANPTRTSHAVARVLQERGYEIVPVNPTAAEVLGEKAYPDLASVPGAVDLVNVFRRPEHLAGVAAEAAAIGAPALWNQLRLVSPEARQIADAAGMVYVEDRCLKVEVARRDAAPAPTPRRTGVMGIVNLNTDSFSDPRSGQDIDERVAAAKQLVADGADIIDLGAQSAALSAAVIDVRDQVAMVVPVTERLVADGIRVSVDTNLAPVASAALRAGASIINDFSGQPTRELVTVVAEAGAQYVLTHNPVGLRVRQQDPDFYPDGVVAAVIDTLTADLGRLASWGLPADRAILDPGVDAGKTPAQTLALLRGRDAVRAAFDQPLLWAISRKDVLGVVTGRGPRERDAATLALLSRLATLDNCIVRVHDVRATVDALKVLAALDGDAALAPDRTLADELRRAGSQ